MLRYIRAMSMSRQRALEQASFYASSIIEYIIKILAYHDVRKDDVDHWMTEIAEWLFRVDDITVKPKNSKLKTSDLYDTVFSCMGDSISDYKRELLMFKEKNRRGQFNYEDKGNYPDFEVTYELCSNLMEICSLIISRTLPLLQDKKEHSRSEYKQVIKDVLDPYISA